MVEAEQKAEEEARRVHKLAEEAQVASRNARVQVRVRVRAGTCSSSTTCHSRVCFVLRCRKTRPAVRQCGKKWERRKQW